MMTLQIKSYVFIIYYQTLVKHIFDPCSLRFNYNHKRARRYQSEREAQEPHRS